MEAHPPLVAFLGGLRRRGRVDVEVDVVEGDAVEVDADPIQLLDRRVVGVAHEIRHRRRRERAAVLRGAGFAGSHGGEGDGLRDGVGLLEAHRPRRPDDDRSALRGRVVTAGREPGRTRALLRLVQWLARVVGEFGDLGGSGGGVVPAPASSAFFALASDLSARLSSSCPLMPALISSRKKAPNVVPSLAYQRHEGRTHTATMAAIITRKAEPEAHCAE
ncbi:hypothetical protein [Streptomyces griseicoloratus]|uniref:hypothetical protein n=1 Tax=Streptomyces griseicoloratus TaxID=2752516 RepID=UPI001CB72ABE|nr:hypothetical protein [Streptomyces griseicoloratus]